MPKLNTSLLREKFVIKDMVEEGHEIVVALSNRITLPLINNDGKTIETFVVRAQNMHTTCRIAARLYQEFQTGGPLAARFKDREWNKVWETVTEGYEQEFNQDCWCAIYQNGKIVFQKGEHHSFLDVIEKFDALQQNEYSEVVRLSEEAFQDAGKAVTIDHDTNVALVVSITPDEARCGVILRIPDHTKTFNFTAWKSEQKKLTVSQVLSVAAAHLEGVQLAFSTGMAKRKLHHGLVDEEEERYRIKQSENRLKRLNRAVLQFDQAHKVNYRPDRPDFFDVLKDAEKYADTLLKPQIQARIDSGDLNSSDWVS